MKKTLLLFGAATMAFAASAATQVLYEQNFENVSTPAEAGWSQTAGTISIEYGEDGKFLKMDLGNNNGRTATGTWGKDIFFKDGESLCPNGEYTLSFDFCIAKGSNSQYNGSFTVFTNHTPLGNQPFRNPWSPAGYWPNYVFDLSQVNKKSLDFSVNGGTTVSSDADGNPVYSIEYTNVATFTQGTWYTVTLNVNTEARTVAYSVVSTSGSELKSGVMEVPAQDVNGNEISMYAEGMHALLARYYTIYELDNIKISVETASDFANEPTISLSGIGVDAEGNVDLNYRAYTVTFAEGETLHLTGTDGTTTDAEYAACAGKYTYGTNLSGELTAWTTSGTATSGKVSATVDCTPVELPAANWSVKGIGEGYAKDYILTVDNASVLLTPAINISYVFTPVEGAPVSVENAASGVVANVGGEGTLTVTTSALGYVSAVTTIENDVEYAVKKVYDFARMTEADIMDAGFPGFNQVLNSSKTSGFDNWTARKRLYYTDENGNKVYPFGFLTADNDNNCIRYSVIDNSEVTEPAEEGRHFAGLTIFPDKGKLEAGLPNICIMQHIGLFNNQTTNSNNNVTVHGINYNDKIVFNTISGYGSDSCHPVCANDEEYFAQLAGVDFIKDPDTCWGPDIWTVTFPLYRIDTVLTKITVYGEKEKISVNVDELAAPAGDGFYYTIDGLRLLQPEKPGLYIHNGKKVIIK